ncbi:aminoglycoside phosphotransferase family protein [Actinomyces wuliandei]|uniref:aminoglycoside phosphotransferase family protein n=1 Tax=Actinomyces wuliandei TaxID=2057743 RepID=UPI001119F2EB|nr:aminoglycoside phosphotransferase family protein [Actinomyces wuliandei]
MSGTSTFPSPSSVPVSPAPVSWEDLPPASYPLDGACLGDTSTTGVLERVLDADWLSARTGAQVRAAHLRVKPEVSMLMSLEDRRTGHASGWARILWPVSTSKARKTLRQLARTGRSATTSCLGGGLVLLVGQVADDPWLLPHLDRALHHGAVGSWEPDDVLRYNPARRLVVRQEHTVARIRAGEVDKGLLLEEVHRFAGSLVPVPRLEEDLGQADPGHVSVQQRCGRQDLAASSQPGDHYQAGALLAALHAGTPQLPARLRQRLPDGHPSPGDLARAHASVLEAVAPDLAARAVSVGAALPRHLPGTPLLVHGDASADQFLHDPSTGQVWLTDFDRARLAPAATDLGAYLSVAPPGVSQAFLSGYAHGGGTVPGREELGTALALARLSRLAEPLHQAAPTWRQDIEETLTYLEEACPWKR